MVNELQHIDIDIQKATQFKPLPTRSQLQYWIEAATKIIPFPSSTDKCELTIRFVDKEESSQLNENYRHKMGPTNIISFPDESIPGFSSISFGDMVLCAPLIAEEAEAQYKTVEAHFAHLVIHGFLHLLGYDHIKAEEAEKMEGLEIEILSIIGYANPYV